MMFLLFNDFDKHYVALKRLSAQKEIKSLDLLLEKLIDAELTYEEVKRLIDVLDNNMLQYANFSLNIRKLSKIINFIETNIDSSDESLFQSFFEHNSFLLPMVFPSLIHFLNGIKFMGGKNAKNQGGIFTDLLYTTGNNNVSIIELKTPKTELIKASTYRGNNEVHPDLIGSIIQAKNQKTTLMKNYRNLKEGTELEDLYTLIDPQIIILIGNSDKLTKEQEKTFDLLRSSLKDISILSFNELITKLKLILDSLREEVNELNV